jgi:hypothetical protein
MRSSAAFSAAALTLCLAACGGQSSSTSGSAGTGGTGATGGTGGATTSGSSGATGGSGGATAGAGGTGGTGGATGGTGGMEYIPTPADVGYGADSPIPMGESILYNDWVPQPNTVLAMAPDGSGVKEVFHAYRVWSMGADPDGSRVAFACGDPKQKEHYGLDLGDAIQHTWLYDSATQQIKLLAYGNINDECHLFGPQKKYLYLCRRYDFMPDFSNKGYRVGRIDLGTLAFEFLTPENTDLDLYPAPTLDEATLYFTRIAVSGGKQKRYIAKQPLPPAASMDVRTDANEPVLSPDGTRYLYNDYTDKGALYSSNLDGSSPVKVVNRPAQGARFSPDGQKIIYLLRDDAANCQHIEIAKSDGSEADSPQRIRDCSKSGEDITEVAWVLRK